MSGRHCGDCGMPLLVLPDGEAHCPECLTAHGAEPSDDTVIEEELMLSDVLRIKSEARP